MYSPVRSPVEPVEVVAGLIFFIGRNPDIQDHILIGQRKSTDSGGGFWEFPGGKVELGEGLFEALRREIKEELEMEVKPLEKLAEQVLQTPSGKWIRLSLVAAESLQECFVLNDHLAAQWIPASQLWSVHFLEGNKNFLKEVEAFYSRRPQIRKI